jgi:membrane fusion protein (multidrug efflux system)
MLRRRMLIMLGVVVIVVLALGGYKAFSIYKQIQQFTAPKPPINVSVAVVQERAWQSRLPAIGTLKALQGVDLALEISGTVKALQFESGQKVKVGQPLVQLDSDVEKGLLGTAEADLGLAQLDFARGSKLVGDGSISRGDFDKLAATQKKAAASVAQLNASLAKKRILAPFSGTIGIRQVDVGDYLASGTVIATLQDLTSLYADFFVPEQVLPKLALGQQVQVSVTAYPDAVFTASISALTPRSKMPRVTCSCAPRCPTPTASCCPACSPICRSSSGRMHSNWWCRKAPLPTRCTATRCMSSCRRTALTVSRKKTTKVNRNWPSNDVS